MTITAYPLCWPAGWPRTTADERRYGRFSRKQRAHGSDWAPTKSITITHALDRIRKELSAFDGGRTRWERIDPDQTVISTNLQVRLDGLPRADQRAPADPGAALYFVMDGHRRCVPCDAYTKVEQNLAAIAATLEALRALERHGSGIMERAFTGFTALPASIVTPRHWRDVLDYRGNDLGECKRCYLRKMAEHHPDKHHGDHSRAADVNAAWEQAQEELANG